MKSKKLIFGILVLTTILIIMQLPVSEADAAASASDFKIEGSTLVRYQGKDKNVSVPNTVDTIGRGAFEENKNIELVVLPNSVKSIEPYAFWGCDNLDTVVLGKGLGEVGDYAFAGCKGLVQMTIPSNVTSIGIQAFGDCINLKDISIPSETGTIHETAFDGCAALTIYCNPGSAADEYAKDFYERQKNMPGYGENPNTDDTVAPGTVVTPEPSPSPEPTEPPAEPQTGEVLGSTHVVGNTAVVFVDNRQLQVYGREDGSGEDPAQSGEFGNGSGPAGDEIWDDGSLSSLEDILHNVWNSGIKKYAVIDGKIVADQAYYRSQNLGGVALPEGILEIGRFSFARSSMTSVILPEGTEKIDYGAFYHCDALSDVMLPDSIMCVEPKAFEHTLWVERFMEGTDDFLVEGGVLIAYRGNAENVSIPDGVRVIAGEVFLNHTEIKSLILPDSLVVVGEGAFEGCSGLTAIEFGRNVEEIKDRAFKGMALSEILVPASVKKLGLQAFGNAMMTYEYSEPEYTYETSAGRLSNTEYRNYGRTGEQEPGVTVIGLDGAAASLEGAERSYTLNIAVPEDISGMENAFRRYLRRDISLESVNAAFYELILTDDSNIPLDQLGNRNLTVELPIPEALRGQEIMLFTLDRNGQLEILPVESISLEDADAIRFQTSQLSVIGMIGAGNTESEVQ